MCDACCRLLFDLDRLDQELVARDDRSGAAAAWTAKARRLPLTAAASKPCRDDLAHQPGSLANRAAADDLQVELERLRDDLAQRPDSHLDHRHPAAVGVPLDRVDDRAR